MALWADCSARRLSLRTRLSDIISTGNPPPADLLTSLAHVFSLVCCVTVSTIAESNLRFELRATTVPHESCKRVMTAMTKALPIAIAALCLVSCDGGGDGEGSRGGGPPLRNPPTYSVGGSVTGLRGTGLVLENNGGDPLTVEANGSFTFATPLARSAAYSVTVGTQPTASPAETCSVTSGSGSVGGAAVTNVTVTCRAMTGKYLYMATELNKISGFLIDPATGALTEIPGSPFAISGWAIGVDKAGKFLFVTGNSLTGYAIDSATGALTQIPGMPIMLPGRGAFVAFQ